MPPKKKVPAKTATESQQAQQRPASQQQKPSVSTTPVQLQVVGNKVQAPRQKPKVEPKKQQSSNNGGVIPTSRPELTEAEIMKMRRQKFRNPSSIIPDEDQKVREERMKKFGVQPQESKQQIEERKKKFSNPSTSIVTEDQETLKQRRLKFSTSSGQIAADAPEVLEERKRKFARNEQALINLDEEIAKTKKIKKTKGRTIRKDNRGKREGRFGNKTQKHSIDRPGKRSRKEIFGKTKFIKRSNLGKKKYVEKQKSHDQ